MIHLGITGIKCGFAGRESVDVQKEITQDTRQDGQRRAENEQDHTVEDDVCHRSVTEPWHHAGAAAQAVESDN